jgi:hypothetical protein
MTLTLGETPVLFSHTSRRRRDKSKIGKIWRDLTGGGR